MSDAIRGKPFTGGPPLPPAQTGEKAGVKEIPAKSNNPALNVKSHQQGQIPPQRPAAEPGAMRPLGQRRISIAQGDKADALSGKRAAAVQLASGDTKAAPRSSIDVRNQDFTYKPTTDISKSSAGYASDHVQSVAVFVKESLLKKGYVAFDAKLFDAIVMNSLDRATATFNVSKSSQPLRLLLNAVNAEMDKLPAYVAAGPDKKSDDLNMIG